MSFTDSEYEEFKSEALELLETAEKSLLALDSGADFQAAFDSVFRSFHNLKGASGMMEMHALQDHTHELESILMPFKTQKEMSKNYINFFLKGIDGAKSLLEGQELNFIYEVSDESKESVALSDSKEIEMKSESIDKAEKIATEKNENINFENSITVPEKEKNKEKDNDQKLTRDLKGEYSKLALDEFFSECDEIVVRFSKQLRTIESGNYDKALLDDVYRDVHSLKGASYLFGYPSVGDITHAMESSMEFLRSGTHKPNKLLIDYLYKAIELVEIEVNGIKKNEPAEIVKLKAPELCQKLIEIGNQLEPLEPLESIPIEKKMQEKITSIDTLENKVTKENIESSEKNESKISKEKESESIGSVRVPVALLDNLMTLMGEMVLVRNQVLQFSSQSEDLAFVVLSKRLNSVTSEIQAEIIKTRMQPIGNILNKFHRVVRDLSQELKKDITLILHGAETELDKTLLEAIKDPLTHIIRNSCDHGIEDLEQRRNVGKKSTGTIIVKSFHEGGQVVVEISDDGKGLDKEILVKKAIEKNLITSQQGSKLSEKEIYNLIFAPGFSTAKAITNVSGRGVGMDVVRTNIERIGGSVDLSSELGHGTTTKIKIPLTLAIVPALIVHSSDSVFAIPQAKLEQLIRIDTTTNGNEIEYLHGSPVYRLRGNILPLIDLNMTLKYTTTPRESNSVFNIAVLNADGIDFGLIVDSIQDTADIVVKPLNKLLKSLKIYSGATILGDGSIALILDPLGLAKVAGLVNQGNETNKLNSKNKIERKQTENQNYLTIRVNSPTLHAIVLNYVYRLEEFPRSKFETSGFQKIVRYGKSILPIVSVSEKLNYTQSSNIENPEIVPVIVVQKGDSFFGLEVNEIVDTLSTNVPVDTSLSLQNGIYGNLNMPEELIVIVDPFQIIGSELFEDRTLNLVMNKSLHILLAEDTVFFRKAVAEILEKAGHTVSTANNGKEALEMLEKNPEKFNLIVSDIEMPKMNGFELAKSIKANKRLSKIPMLALSTRADKKYIEEGMSSGFDVYLEKLKPNVLINAISRITETQRSAS